MNYSIFIENFSLPDVSQKEVLRYAGVSTPDESILSLLQECIKEANITTGKIVYTTLPITKVSDGLCIGPIKTKSKNLDTFLKGNNETTLFAATIGIRFDQLITKYSILSPSKALMFQALGSERVEALCDVFCDFIKEKKGSSNTKRFSPGYGDLPLTHQKEILTLLSAEKNCGIYLNESFLMAPSKSVTAFIKTEQ